jgi:hypothetical protein
MGLGRVGVEHPRGGTMHHDVRRTAPRPADVMRSKVEGEAILTAGQSVFGVTMLRQSPNSRGVGT